MNHYLVIFNDGTILSVKGASAYEARDNAVECALEVQDVVGTVVGITRVA